MTTISVKVWDFKKGMSGKKITKTKKITVNKNIAGTVKKIFEEIYKGKEKAPIYSAGGFSWRTGQHGQGLAIDLNPKYNYFINNNTKKILSGKYWNPKKYAYSIKRNGDIEKAFAKYGFARGFWSTKSDYMHFSYFGV
ncbi:D-alanyl-D-alanine carboxypeptidase [Lachnospiraceae bacterium TWA4]|nr:D-alanyl-D-alanine carboxypeptidase [Lachnospiraceae bacterium TWA4]